ncbi:MAG: glycosyl transferase family protein, partial [Bacteroidetes bacterium]|nr:glycosyl transferase family protein [Bacteroidota bacterium]
MLNVSVVIYKHEFNETSLIVTTLAKSEAIETIYLIDNSPTRNEAFSKLGVEYIFNNKNLGYGAAHNIAIRKTIEQNVSYHLVINPDIKFENRILDELVDFMQKNSDVGQLMPKVLYPNGEIQYLCKLLPTPSDLIFRRFLPKKWTEKSNSRFEMHNSGYNQIMDVPYLSGCFMLLRTDALRHTGMFD